VLGTIVADMQASRPDHLAVTGDLVNLALDAEIELARIWLEALGRPDDISVVPGNHDAYVPGAFDKTCRAWGPWMTGDGASPPADRNGFPYMRVRGQVALIGVSTARATAPFMASGFFREDQSHRLGGMLDQAAKRGLFRVAFSRPRSTSTAPNWCCTAIHICRPSTGSAAVTGRCRWSARPQGARRPAIPSRPRSTISSTSTEKPAPGQSA
jgi:3',5'-cyclic AMP phosphodiesterase CpdA